MKMYRHWALAMVLASPTMVLAAEPTTPPCAASSSAADGMELIDLIDKVSKRTGKQFIVDPRVRAQVPKAGIDLDKVDYARLLAILNVHQFGTYEANGVVRVVPDANARQMPIPVTTDVPAKALDDEYVTVIITAKNMCMAHAVPVLRPLMPQAAHMAADVQSNSLIISDRAANARRIVDMVERLDKAAPAGQKCPPDMWPPAKSDRAEKK
ncbi:MAG TPA: secretin N-terminal domain-containing protein [Steroidobacteraceae bacterium]|nr:secretin N-terminal domain-containing protein [Steroidobacteraceae bacterium]